MVRFDRAEIERWLASAARPEPLVETGEARSIPSGIRTTEAATAAPDETEPALPSIYYTGLAGRPSSWHLIEAEFRRRWQIGERYPGMGAGGQSPADWARVLCLWLRSKHPQAPKATERTVSNRLSSLLASLCANSPIS